MSAKAISEATGKGLLNKFLGSSASVVKSQFAVVDQNSDWQKIVEDHPWLLKEVSILYFNLSTPALQFFLNFSHFK